MSGRIKYGETYESLAANLYPFINDCTNTVAVPGRLKYGQTYENLAFCVYPYIKYTDKVNTGRIKYAETYESIASNIFSYLPNKSMWAAQYSLYPIWWDTTITIYNKFEDPNTQLITWYKNVLPNNFWKNSHNKINVGQTILETNNIILRVPENNFFKEYGQWLLVGTSDRINYFTFNQGDIIVKGEVEDIINEYETGHRSTDLLSKYKNQGDCFQIVSYQNNTGIGRGTPHYYVQGV